MTRRERLLVKRAKAVFRALERCTRWEGTGGKRQQNAYETLNRAERQWEAALNQIKESAGETRNA